MEEYYTPREAIEKLDIPASTFYHLVKIGKITKVPSPTSSKRGVYLKEQINKLAKSLAAFKQGYIASMN